MATLNELSDQEFSALILLYRQSKFNDLVWSCNSFIERFPKSPKLHNIQGVAYSGLKEFTLAIDCYKRALKLNPNYAEAHNNMGNTLKTKGDFDLAIKSFKTAILLKPEFAEAYNNMGASYLANGDYSLAGYQFKKAIDIKIDYVDAYINNGTVLRFLKDFDGSIQNFKKALSYNSEATDAHFLMGLSLRDSERFKDAIISFEKVIKLKPNHFEAYNYLGNSLKSIGNTEKAIKFFKKVLSLKEDFFEVHRHLAFARKYSGSEDQIQKLLNFADLPSLSNEDQINISFALGKIYEDLKEFNKSFLFFAKGNRLRKKELNYDTDYDIKLFNSIKKRFTQKISSELLSNEANDSRKITPIFIVGMPRSGTTLIEQIVSSHSHVHGGGELNFLGKGIEIYQLVNEDLTEDLQSQLCDYYFHELQTLRVQQNIITDKMPLNFRWCGFIIKAIPQAKIIHVSRNKMATCFSLFKSYFSSSGNSYAYDLKDIASYYNLYDDLMQFWHKTFPTKIYKISYEKLTEAPEKEIRKLISFCDLKWEGNCLDFHKNDRPVITLSKTQVREKIYTGSSLNWKNFDQFVRDFKV